MNADALLRQKRGLISRTEEGLGHVQIEKVYRAAFLRGKGQGKIDRNLAFAAARLPNEDKVVRAGIARSYGRLYIVHHRIPPLLMNVHLYYTQTLDRFQDVFLYFIKYILYA